MFHVSTMLPYMPNNPQQVRHTHTHMHMHISTSKSLYRTDMTKLILTQPSPSLPPGQTPRMSCTLFTCYSFSLLIFSSVFVVGTACGRPSLQRNIWNGSKVYRVAAVNPVEIQQLFFHAAQVATASGRPLSESVFFVTCGYEGIAVALSFSVRYCHVLPLFLYALAYESEQGVVF